MTNLIMARGMFVDRRVAGEAGRDLGGITSVSGWREGGRGWGNGPAKELGEWLGRTVLRFL